MRGDALSGARVCVTGANRGLGKALVAAALERGASRVYAAVRDPALLAGHDERIVPVALDLTDHAAIAAAAERCGACDILVNNAAFLANMSALRAETLDDARREMDTNYFGLAAMTRAFAPVLEARRGTMINILSMGALATVPFAGSYCASKAAAWSLTQGAHAELKGRVRVMAVFPGPIATEMARESERDGRALPQDVAAAIFDALAGDADTVFPDPVSRRVANVLGETATRLPTLFAAKIQ